MVTMKDVAKVADVSVATVSRVIAGKSVVTATNHEKVMRAVDELGYELNISARNLSRKQSENIGMVIPAGGCHTPGFSRLVEVLIKLATTYGKMLIIREAEPSVEGEVSALNFVNHQGCALVIFRPKYSTSAQAANLVSMMNSPVIVIGRRVCNAVSVWSDYFSAASQATDLLIRYGHRRILLAGEIQDDSGREIFRGHRVALRKHNIPYHSSLVLQTGTDMCETREQLSQFMTNDGDATALILTDIAGYYGAVSALDRVSMANEPPAIVCFTQQTEFALECSGVSTMNIPIIDTYQSVMTAAKRILLGETFIEDIRVRGRMIIKSDLSIDESNLDLLSL